MLLFVLAGAFANPIPAGEMLNESLLVDIPPQGFEALEGVIPGLIPSPIEIPEFAEESSACPTGGYWYKFQLKNATAGIEVQNVFLTPQNGYMDMEMDLAINLNDPNDRFKLNYWLVCIKYPCRGYVDPFPTNVIGAFNIAFVDEDGDGIKEADVQFTEDLSIDIGLTGDHIHLAECPLNFLEDVFNFFGGSLYELVINAIDVNTIISDALPEIELAIEDALNQANIDETVDLGGTSLRIQMTPNQAILQPEGLRMVFDSSSSVEEPAECVLDYDPLSSKGTENPSATLEEFPSAFDFGATVADDFVNQTLYSLWSGGALCQTIDEDVFALDTSILNLVTGDAYLEFFPETVPMLIRTNPQKAPTLNMETASDIGIEIEELGLDFYAEIDGRQARVLGMNLNTQVGVDLNLDSQTGALDLALDIDTQNVAANISFNEFLPSDQNTVIEQEFVGQLDTILGLVDIEALLGDLNITLPAISLGESSIGLESMLIKSTGSAQEDMTIFANLGPVPYGAGCGSEESEGCGGGCSTASSGFGRSFLLLLVLAGAFRRRM